MAAVALVLATISFGATSLALDAFGKADAAQRTTMRDLAEAALAMERLRGHAASLAYEIRETLSGDDPVRSRANAVRAIALGRDDLAEMAVRLPDRHASIAGMSQDYSRLSEFADRATGNRTLFVRTRDRVSSDGLRGPLASLSSSIDDLASETKARLESSKLGHEALSGTVLHSMAACLVCWATTAAFGAVWGMWIACTSYRGAAQRRSSLARATCEGIAHKPRPWPGTERAGFGSGRPARSSYG